MGLLNKIKNKAKSAGGDGGGFVGGGGAQTQMNFGSGVPSAPLEQSMNRYRFQRGLNLGSWFTTEAWLATQLYSHAADPKQSDFDLARANDAKALMEHHWDTWVTDDDWNWIKQRGFNSVRIPIGYYHLAGPCPDALKGTDYEKYGAVYTGAWDRIQAAIQKAGSMGLGVLVDFHSAAGAQNEDAHSGLSNGEVKFWKDKNLRATSIALRFLASQLAGNPAVIGLELLNEPKDNQGLKDWYDREINELRPITNPDFPIYVSDAWVTDFYAGYVGSRGDFVVMDHHLYRCFTHEDKCMTGCQHADKLQQDQGQFAHWSQQCHNQWVVGEWSAALDDSGCQGMSDGEKDANKRAFVKAQLDCFDRHTAGYFFWTLKTDRPWDAGWSAQNAAQAEILPASVQKQIRTPDQGQRDGACHQATDQHVNYWQQNNGNPQPQLFSDGFLRGWDDACRFIAQGDTLGFWWAWSRRRAQEIGVAGQPEAWQWDGGFEQGVKAANQAAGFYQ